MKGWEEGGKNGVGRKEGKSKEGNKNSNVVSFSNLDSALKNRDITLSTKVCIVKAVVAQVVKDLPAVQETQV